MLICYLSSKEKRLYKLSGETLIPISSFKLSLLSKLIHKRLVILSKDIIFHVKKRFPLLSPQELKQAVASEVEYISPYPNYEYYYQVERSFANFAEVHIWVWDKSPLDQLLATGFSYTHIIPEDLIFTSDKSCLFILPHGPLYYIIATCEKGYLSSSILTSLSEELPLFLRTLSDFKPQEIILFAQLPPQEEQALLKAFPPPSPLLRRERDFFLWLPRFLKRLNLKNFRAKKRLTFAPLNLVYTSSRLFLYSTLILSFYFYFSQKAYQSEINRIKQESIKIDLQLKTLTERALNKSAQPDFELKLTEFKEELRKKEETRLKSLLKILDELASVLPDESQIRTFELKEKKLRLNLITNDAVEIIEKIRALPSVENIRLTNPPFFDKHRNKFTMQIEVTLRNHD